METVTDVRGRRVYLSGPMSGVEDLNRPAFAEAERQLYDMGARWVFNPCEHWRRDGRVPEWPREEFMRRDLHYLTGGGIDALVLLDGWGLSAGAYLERWVAASVGIPVARMDDLLALGDGASS